MVRLDESKKLGSWFEDGSMAFIKPYVDIRVDSMLNQSARVGSSRDSLSNFDTSLDFHFLQLIMILEVTNGLESL